MHIGKLSKILLLAAFVVLAGLLAKACFVATLDSMIDEALQGTPGRPVDPKAWSRVRVGMTKQQVRALLGEPDAKREEPDRPSTTYGAYWWQYGWTEGALTIQYDDPEFDGYVVFFSDAGVVTGTRDPIAKPKEP